jgi:hypothetical protein
MRLSMHNFTVAIFVSFALFASAQERTVVVVPSKPSTPVPRMEKGLVYGRTYKNPSIGLELTLAAGLAFETPELKGTPGTVPLLVTVSAWGKQGLFSARNGTIFYADALAYYPDGQRSTDAYVRKVIRGNRQEGFEAVEQNLQANLGGVSFARTDFKQGSVYEAVLVKSCDALAFVFIFTGSDGNAVNKLIAATDLKLDFVRSGCRPAGAANK